MSRLPRRERWWHHALRARERKQMLTLSGEVSKAFGERARDQVRRRQSGLGVSSVDTSLSECGELSATEERVCCAAVDASRFVLSR